jgi:hypothetical protein
MASMDASVRAPVSRGRVVIVHAGSENGFIPNALIVISVMKSGNYLHRMVLTCASAFRLELWGGQGKWSSLSVLSAVIESA